jgi:hypothetical protein
MKPNKKGLSVSLFPYFSERKISLIHFVLNQYRENTTIGAYRYQIIFFRTPPHDSICPKINGLAAQNVFLLFKGPGSLEKNLKNRRNC